MGTTSPLDDIDRAILSRLQRDARHTTATEIAAEIDVSPNTVRNRISRMESEQIIIGYQPTIDYERADFPLKILIVCSAQIDERTAFAEEAADVPGVVNVRELMRGTENVRIEAVGTSSDDITRIVTDLSRIGLVVSDEILIKNEYVSPFTTWSLVESEQNDHE